MKQFTPGVGRVMQPPQAKRTQSESEAAKAARLERGRFYAATRWIKLSRQVLAANPLCVWCGKLAEMVDHIIPRLERPDLAFDRDNLRSCCRRCHAIHGEKVTSDKNTGGVGKLF